MSCEILTWTAMHERYFCPIIAQPYKYWMLRILYIWDMWVYLLSLFLLHLKRDESKKYYRLFFTKTTPTSSHPSFWTLYIWFLSPYSIIPPIPPHIHGHFLRGRGMVCSDTILHYFWWVKFQIAVISKNERWSMMSVSNYM